MATGYLGGLKEDQESINGNYNAGGWATPGDPYDGDGSSWVRIQSLRADYLGVRPYLNVQNYIDFMLLYLFGGCENEWRSTGPKNIGSGAKYFLNDADGYLPTASYATVYFTKDGSDPRLAGGAVNPAAFTSTSTAMTANTWLRARAKSGATWSALNEAFYTVTPLVLGDVVFSEIHYNPMGDDDSEFIELWNRTAHAVNLRGAKFTAGIDYAFPHNRDVPLAPGGRLVLVASLYTATARRRKRGRRTRRRRCNSCACG